MNLRSGQLPLAGAEGQLTCTACAGTLLLEFGALSALTGDTRFVAAAERAARALFERRSPIGLVGGYINVTRCAREGRCMRVHGGW